MDELSLVNGRFKEYGEMKVALINSAPIRTGRGNYTYHLLCELRKLGIQVDVFSVNAFEAKCFNDAYVLRRHSWRPSLIRKVCDRLVLPQKVPNGYDLYHIISEGISYFAKHHSPSVVTCHDGPSYFRHTSIFLRYLRMKANYNSMFRASKIITATHYSKQDLIRNLGISSEKISVIPHGVDHKRFRPVDKRIARKNLALPLNETIILGLDSDKLHNISSLVKACSLMQSRILLLILGRPNKYLVEIIRHLNLGNRVKWCYNVPDREMSFVYGAADILVHPSYYEGFGFPLLEAMACGTPIITTKYGAIPEVVGDSALFIDDPSDYELLMDTMENLLQSKEMRDELRDSSLRRAMKFSWEKTAVKTLSTYMKTLAISKSPTNHT